MPPIADVHGRAAPSAPRIARVRRRPASDPSGDRVRRPFPDRPRAFAALRAPPPIAHNVVPPTCI
ncbi:Hypothetical protein I596_311 [Dokdonella koreensis DS-123]|uniref:Uncharacterized protein n=1 Tax=Dokdonella koreensis DS-123 TaxID=1300342 RepID=A0A167GAR2_9GAMM|nr:Hypothetical protein I596_311 [Dokdonella koreensis DS-123]